MKQYTYFVELEEEEDKRRWLIVHSNADEHMMQKKWGFIIRPTFPLFYVRPWLGTSGGLLQSMSQSLHRQQGSRQ